MKQEDRDMLIRIDEKVSSLIEHVAKQNGRVLKLEGNQNKLLGGVFFITAAGTAFINWIKEQV
tara:strand:+ start:924 stop:1112 length:189 start_codon:yes stop_codon:yes gene_type:complete